MWAAGVVILGGPLWLAAVFVGVWTLAVESWDTVKYGRRFPWPIVSWSPDSRWDAFQILGGASFVLIGWWCFLVFLALYFVFVLRQK
jgi:hypothetical protein